MLNRRKMLQSLGATLAATSVPGVAFADASTEQRFILIVLRGALDGLALVPPYGDSNYASVRGELALPQPTSSDGVLPLNSFFGLHPSMVNFHRWYGDDDALVVHAIASPYRERSHFDGQDLLESGGAGVGRVRDGWLNRALQPLGGSIGNEQAIAMAQNTPLVLRGSHSVTSWAPSQLPDADQSTLNRLQRLYADDEFFATRLEQALRSQDIAGEMGSSRQRGNEARQFAELMSSTARFLTAPNGPKIAVAELGGWDTHANQGAIGGALANRLSALDSGLSNLRSGLGDQWSTTVVAVVTEFGRTVGVNGTRGTDHGTASAALLLGGAVAGGRVITDWPGLRKSELLAERDLFPTADLRGFFKGVLVDHLSLDSGFVDSRVFPDSANISMMENLLKS